MSEGTERHDAPGGGEQPGLPPGGWDTAFSPGPPDGAMAVFALVLGYFFWRWVSFTASGWGVAAFTAAYLASTLAYLRAKGSRPCGKSWFWFAATLAVGASFALWDANSLAPLKTALLFLLAVYWAMSATSSQLYGRTGNHLLIDGLSAVFAIPFGNFPNEFKALFSFASPQRNLAGRALSAVLGVVLALVLSAAVVPMLLSADSGGFSALVDSLSGLFSLNWPDVVDFLLHCVLAVPTAAYIFGLVSGCATGRVPGARAAERAKRAALTVRVIPPATVLSFLGLTCAVYAAFILAQLPYFFSAFSGRVPYGWLSYAEYARRGFFDLCGVAFINLAVLAASSLFCKKPRAEFAPLRALAVALSAITLVLIATALAKLALYVGEYGLTAQRILPGVFMVFLAVVFIGVIAAQKAEFSVVRLSAVAGAVLFSAVCLADPDTLAVRYNTARYLGGTLAGYDVSVLYRSGPAGVPCASEVYSLTHDEALKQELRSYLEHQRACLEGKEGTFRDTLQDARSRAALNGL